MSKEHFEETLEYYQQEMMYLLRAGARFVDRYPKVAQNLNLSAAGSSDPHVQRLLESFAFLTGRLQKEVDNRYIQFTNTLLGVLYPQFVDPFPSASVAQFRISPHLGKTTAGSLVPRGTELFSEAQENKICRFQTVYPIELWPLEVSEAQVVNLDETTLNPALFETQWLLQIRVNRYDGKISELNPSFLRFHISGDTLTTQCLYDSIFSYQANSPTPVFFKADTADQPTKLSPDALSPVGFDDNEALIPYPQNALSAYRLLHEYFVFPNKFNFIDIKGFTTAEANEYIDFFIPLADQTQAGKLKVNKHNFVLGCTPIVNLFSKISEPIDLNNQSVSYRLIGDLRNEDTTEIHTILKVVAAVDGGKDTETFAPYFSYNYDIEKKANGLFWHSTRTPSELPNVTGTDVSLSFVDYNFTPQKPSEQTVYAYTLCTNRELPTYIPAGGALQVEGSIPSATITCLTQPSQPCPPSLDGDAQWRLISQLSLNHLSLSGGDKAISALRELLQLYSTFNKSHAHPEINTLQSVSYEPVMRRHSAESWKGFIQGLSISLNLDETPYAGHGGFLLACVLNHFFNLYVSINSFTELTLTSSKSNGIWKKWPAKIGAQPLV